MSQIYEKLLEFRPINYYGLRMSLHFRHNSIVPYQFDKGGNNLTLLFIWNNICYHKMTHRLRPRELNDSVIVELLTLDLSPELCGVLRNHFRGYLNDLEQIGLIKKFESTYIINPYYCNSLSLPQREYVVKMLLTLANSV